MKIAQNKIWMHCLMLGIFSIILSSFSCNKRIDYVQYGEFYFDNQTTRQINLDYPDTKFIIGPEKVYILKQTQTGPKHPTAETYSEPISQLTNRNQAEVIIKIGDKCFVSTDSSEHSIVNIKSYVPEKIDERTYKFTYTFTEADYQKAVACP